MDRGKVDYRDQDLLVDNLMLLITLNDSISVDDIPHFVYVVMLILVLKKTLQMLLNGRLIYVMVVIF